MKAALLLCALAALDTSLGQAQGQRMMLEWKDGLEWRLWMGHPCTRDARALRRLVFSP
jgi:hypothetical protein